MLDDSKQTQPNNVTNVTHGGIKLEKDASLTVGQGDVVAGDKIVTVVNQIVQGLGDLPTRYDSYVRNFLDYYLGTPDRPAPFGGRSADLAALDAWLADPNAPPYLLLAAPAGRGKSALLAHWVARLTDREAAPQAVFFPISIRFSSNRESVVFAALYARIAHLHGDKATRAADAHEYRSVFMDYVRRPPPDGNRLLIVLDGLDEAAGWEAGADLFPTQPPPHLRVVVAARALAGDLDWQTRLGWESPGKAKTLSLAGLDRDGVRDVLAQMGNPLDWLATKFDVVEKLHELSEGDPLLVRLYVEALLPRGSEAATFKPKDLLTLKPGLKPYFDLWFKQQESLWASAAERTDHDAVDDLLNLCATALGPLTKDDARALAPERLKNSRTIERTVEAINRFVIGDGTEKSGYVFSHPRLREYFADRLTAKERKEWEARFLRYGKETLTALEAKALKPGEAPAYAVKYYGAHLTRANAPAADFYALMCEGWLRAWEWADGTPDGFLNDARRAWARAEAEGPEALGQIVRAALCLSSMVSVSANISNDLLIACVKSGVINLRLGLMMARAKLEAKDRAECLARASQFLTTDERLAVLAEALNAARVVGDESGRANALSEVAKNLSSEETDLLVEVINAARAVEDESGRATALSAVVEHLPLEEQMAVLAEALSAVQAVNDEFSGADTLGMVAEHLPPEAVDLLAEALNTARAVSNEGYRAVTLSTVAKLLPLEEQKAVLAEALRAARAVKGNKYARAYALSAVAKHLPPNEQGMELAKILSVLRSVSDEFGFAYALKAVIESLPPEATDSLAEALSIARSIGNERDRADVLKTIAERLPSEEQKTVLAEALNAARAVRDEVDRADALRAVAEHLPLEEQRAVLNEVLNMAQAVRDEDDRAITLSVIAERLPPKEQRAMLAGALNLAQSIKSEESRTYALSMIVERLPLQELRAITTKVLSAVRTMPDESRRFYTLHSMVKRLVPEEQREVLVVALDTARAIKDEENRADSLSMVAELLPPEEQKAVLAEAINVARAVTNESYRAVTLSMMAKRLPPEEQRTVLAEALNSARAVRDKAGRADALRVVAERLPSEECQEAIDEALGVARAIGDERARAESLIVVAERLPIQEQATVLAEALNAVRMIKNEESRTYALSRVARGLPRGERQKVIAEALRAARAIENECDRIRALISVAEYLPSKEQGAVVAEALNAARVISNKSYHAVVTLVTVAERLPLRERGVVLAEALTAAWAMNDASALQIVVERLPTGATDLHRELLRGIRSLANQRKSIAILQHLAPHWSAMCRAHQLSEFGELSGTLRAFAKARRENLLGAIEALLPVIARLGGERAVRETAQAIMDTAKWWP